MDRHSAREYLVSAESEEGIRFRRTGVPDGYMLPYGFRALNLHLLQEQEVLLITESLFQPYLYMYLFYLITYWVQFDLPIYSQEWGHPLEPGRSTRGHTLEVNWHSLSQKPSIVGSPSIGEEGVYEPLPSPC